MTPSLREALAREAEAADNNARAWTGKTSKSASEVYTDMARTLRYLAALAAPDEGRPEAAKMLEALDAIERNLPLCITAPIAATSFIAGRVEFLRAALAAPASPEPRPKTDHKHWYMRGWHEGQAAMQEAAAEAMPDDSGLAAVVRSIRPFLPDPGFPAASPEPERERCKAGCKGIEIEPGSWSGCKCLGSLCDCPQHPVTAASPEPERERRALEAAGALPCGRCGHIPWRLNGVLVECGHGFPPASPPSPAPACEPCHGTGRLSGHYEGARCRPCNGTGRAPTQSPAADARKGE